MPEITFDPKYGIEPVKKSEVVKDNLERLRDYYSQEVPIVPVGQYFPDDSRYDKDIQESNLQDIEDYRAQQQSFAAKATNGIAKGLGLAATTFATTFTSLPYGIVNAAIEGDFSKVYDNEVSNLYDQFNEGMEKVFPNYYSSEERSADAFNPKNWWTTNFLFDKLVKNAGFTLGAITSGSIVAKGFQALGKIAMGGRYAEELARVETLASQYVRNGLESSKAFTKAIEEVGKGIKLVNGATKLGAVSVAAATEGSFEALQAKQSTTEQLIQQYRDGHNGEYPDEVALDRIDDYASAAGNVTFATNMAILAGSDYIQFGRFLRGTRDEKKIIGNILKDADKYVSKEALKTSDYIKPFKGLLTESTEEGLQTFTQSSTQDYFSRKYDADAKGKTISAIQSLVKGFEDTFGTKEGLESMLLGGLTGIGASVVTGEARRDIAGTRQRINATQIAVDNLNKYVPKAILDNAIRSQSLSKDMEKAILGNDVFAYKNLKHDLFKSYVQSRIDAGKFDNLVEEINGLKDLDAEEFKDLYGFDKTAETSKTTNDYVTKLLEEATRIKDVRNAIEDRFSGYADAIKEKAFDYITNIQDRSSRIESIKNTLNKANVSELYTAIDNFVEASEGIKVGERITSRRDLNKLVKDNKSKFAEHNILEPGKLINDLISITRDRAKYAKKYETLITPEGTEAEGKSIAKIEQQATANIQKEQERKLAYEDFLNTHGINDNLYLLKIPGQTQPETEAGLVKIRYKTANGSDVEAIGNILPGEPFFQNEIEMQYFQPQGKKGTKIAVPVEREEEAVSAKVKKKVPVEPVVAKLNPDGTFAEIAPDGTETGRTFSSYDYFDKISPDDIIDLNTIEDEIPLNADLFKYDPTQDSDNYSDVGRAGLPFDTDEYENVWYGSRSRLSEPEFNRTTGSYTTTEGKNWYNAISRLTFDKKEKYYLKPFTYESWKKVRESSPELSALFDEGNPLDIQESNIKVILLINNRPVLDGTGKAVTTSLMEATEFVVNSKGEKIFRFKDSDPATVERNKKEHEAFRNWLLQTISKEKEILLKVTGRSRGIPNDLRVEGKRIRSNVLGRLITDAKDLKSLDIIVATGKNDIMITGDRVIQTTPGLTYFRTTEGNVVPALNRRITSDEAVNIMKLLQLYAKRSTKPIVGTEAEKTEIKRERTTVKAKDQNGNNIIGFNLLRQVADLIYFGANYKLGDGTYKIHDNPKTLVYIKNGYIYFGGDRARTIVNSQGKVSFQAAYAVRFTPDAIAAEIEKGEDSNFYQFLTSLAHQVVKVKLDKQDGFDKIRAVDIENETVDVDSYPSYKEYLIQGDNPVLGTSIIEKDNEQGEPQFNSINLYYKYPTFSNPVSKPTEKTKAEEVKLTNLANIDLSTIDNLIDQFEAKAADVSATEKLPNPFEGTTTISEVELTGDISDIDINKYKVDDEIEEVPFRLESLRTSDRKEDVSKFTEWFYQRFPKTLDIKTVADIVDNKAMGKVQDWVTTIWEDAEEGTGFHEAWHNLTQYILTPKERDSLYKEYRNINPDFRGNVEEILAEEFRHYMLSLGEKAFDAPIRKSLFEKILTWIKDFYNHVILGNPLTIQEAFGKLQEGYYKNTEIIKEVNLRSNPLYSIQGVSETESKEILSSLSGHFARYLFAENKTFVDLSEYDPLEPVNIDRIYRGVYNSNVRRLGELVEKNKTIALSPIEVKEAKTIQYILDNWVKVRDTHIVSFGGKYGVKSSLKDDVGDEHKLSSITENTGDDTSKKKDSIGAIESNRFSPQETLSKPIKLLIGTLFKRERNGDLSIGESTGLLQTVDFENTYNFILQKLVGLTKLEDMIEELRSHYAVRPELKGIEDRLKYTESLETLSKSDIALRVKFVQAFSKTQDAYDVLLVDDDGKIYSTDAVSTRASDKVKELWKTSVRNSPYASVTSAGIQVDHSKLLSDLKGKYGNLNSVEAQLSYLQGLGINFGDEFNFRSLSKEDKEKFYKAVSWIRESIDRNKGKYFDIFTDETGVKGRLSFLINLYSEYSNEVSDLQFINAEGETVYSITLNNYMSLIANQLNKGIVPPHLVDDIYSKDSIVLKEKRKTVLGVMDGMRYNRPGEQGTSTSDMKRGDLIATHFNAILQGKYPIFRTSDKPTERSVEWGKFIDKKDIQFDPLTKKIFLSDRVYSIFLSYLQTEIDRTISLRKGLGQDIDTYNTKAKGLSFFHDIITETQFPLLPAILRGEKRLSDLNTERVKDAITHYFFGENTTESFRKFEGLVGRSYRLLSIYRILDGRRSAVGFQILPVGIGQDLIPSSQRNANGTISEETAYEMVAYAMINQTIAYIEQTKVFTGDIALYKDPFKRFGGLVGTKKLTITDPDILGWMNLNMHRQDGRDRDGNINSVVYNDPIVSSDYLQEYTEVLTNFYTDEYRDLIKDKNELSNFVKSKVTRELAPYANITEPDGQGYCTLDEFRDLLFLAGDWSARAERAYEKAVRGDSLSKEEMYYFQPQKFMYYGPQDYQGLNVTTYYKYSVMPLIPSLVRGTKFENMLKSMVSTQTGMLLFKSANKVGNRQADNKALEFYKDDGTVNTLTDEIAKAYTQRIAMNYFGIQVDIAPKVKKQVIWGTQMRKLIYSNLFTEGKIKPITIFQQGKATKSVDATLQLMKEYQDITRQIVKVDKDNLLSKLRLTKDSGGDYHVSDPKEFIRILSEEAIARNSPDNIIDGIKSLVTANAEGLPVIRYTFDVLPNRNKIENILMSLIDNNIIRTKMFGGMKIQGASTGMESAEFTRHQIARDEEAIKWGSNELKFYRRDPKTGKTLPMQVKLPHYFKEKLGMGIGTIDKRLLYTVGYRIPTDGLSTVDDVEIVEFLPPEAGDLIILPSEIVAKAGSDYDIDKFNILFPNYTIQSPDGEDILTLINNEIKKNLPHFDISELFDITKSDEEYDRLLNIVERVENYPDQAETKDFIIYGAYKNVDASNFSLTYEEPKGVSGIEFWSRRQLQNRIIEIYQTILESPEMLPHLIDPLSADILKDRANYVRWLNDYVAQRENIPYEQYTRNIAESATSTFEWTKNLEKWNDFLSGIKLVGQTALHVTHHTLAQQANLRLSPAFKGKLRFNVKDELSLAQEKDTKGNFISRTLRAFLHGAVDVAKDPFIFAINATNVTAQVYYYLVRRGVSIDELTLFMSQPIIKAYLRLQAINESTILEAASQSPRFGSLVRTKSRDAIIRDAKEEIIGKAGIPTIDSLPVDNELFTEGVLEEGIRKNTLRSFDKDWASTQVQILDSFIQYLDESKKLGDLVGNMNYDTKFSKTLAENEARNIISDAVISSPDFVNADRLISDTFIGEYMDVAKDTNHLYSDLFLTERETSRFILSPLKNFFIEHTTKVDDLLKTLNKVKDDYVTFLLQTMKIRGRVSEYSISETLLNVMYGRDSKGVKLQNGSIAEQVYLIKNNLNHPLFNNLWIKEMFPLINRDANSSNVHNLKLFNRRITTDKANSLTNAFEELYGYDPTLGQGIITLGILQSGISESPVSYLKYIPFNRFAVVSEQVLAKYLDISEGTANPENYLAEFTDQFFRNNWRDKNIVPYFKHERFSPMYGGKVSSLAKDGKTLYIWEEFSQAQFPYVRIATKEGNKWNSRLFKRVSITTNEKNEYTYYEASPLGDGMYSKEYRTTLSNSWILPNKVDERISSPFKDIISRGETVRTELDWMKEDNNSEVPICKK